MVHPGVNMICVEISRTWCGTPRSTGRQSQRPRRLPSAPSHADKGHAKSDKGVGEWSVRPQIDPKGAESGPK